MEYEKSVIGGQYGQWTVVSNIREARGNCDSMWSCKCKCGRGLALSSYKLMQYKNKDKRLDYKNGCRFCENKRYKGHPILVEGGKRLPVYGVWLNIKNRCGNPAHRNYKDYGGRGITICKEWENNFLAFYNYVSKLEHYGENGRSLDRIDNNGGYCTGNVRWATAKEQANNTRRSKKYRESENK